jgi:hypothetical protein
MITAAVQEREDYLNVSHGLKSWLLTKDHKRIGLLYLATITLFFFLGGLFATLIRLELLTPNGGLVSSETYNKLFTMHGVTMIFFFLIPSIPAVLGNFFLPMMIGARDLAFPRINLLSWYLLVIGGLFALFAMLAGGVDTGWTFYTPYSTTYSNTWVIATALGIFVAGFSSILTGLNFIVTVHRMRAPGMTWFRMPLFVWAHYATALIQVLGTPVLAVTLVLVLCERVFHIGIFDPALGGDPVLFQHLFWFYSHPAVYIMILPAMGVCQRVDFDLLAQGHLRLPHRGLFERGHRGARLPGVGPSHVRQRPIAFCRHGVLVPELLCGHTVGHQGVQLDGHAVQGLHLLRHADAIRFRFHRPVHHRRTDGAFRGGAGHRRARHRHLLRGGALPLHHGGRRHHGLPGRPALLVAEDDGAHVSGRVGEALGAGDLPGLQPDVLPAVHSRVPGDAAALPHLSGRVPGAARALHRGRFGAGGGLSDAHDLLHLVAALRQGGGANPWGATGLEWKTASPPPLHNFDRFRWSRTMLTTTAR